MTDPQMAADRALVERTTRRYADGWTVQWYEALELRDALSRRLTGVERLREALQLASMAVPWRQKKLHALIHRALTGAGEGETP